jgi:hypothetical protein
MKPSQFSTKIAIILEKGLLQWQELNVTAFLASAIASRFPETLGPEFTDASKQTYLAIFRQPVLIFQATTGELKKTYRLGREQNLYIGIYTRPIFQTQGDENVKVIAEVTEEKQDLVGIILYGDIDAVNRCTKQISLHK